MSGAAAIVLAAGAGARLGGACKATLTLPGGASFLAAIVDRARRAGCARVIVVAGHPHEATVRAAARAIGGVDVVANPEPARGMSSSLALAVEALDPAAVEVALAWPVDHPLVTLKTAAAILAAAGRDRIVVPVSGGHGGHPTAFGVSTWRELQRAAGGEGGARVVVLANPRRVVRLEVDDPGVTTDIDTPEDYDRIKGGEPT